MKAKVLRSQAAAAYHGTRLARVIEQQNIADAQMGDITICCAVDAENGPIPPDQRAPALWELREMRKSEALTFRIRTGRYNIGRAPENEFRLSDGFVSRFHVALVCHRDGRLVVTDLGSKNGMLVDRGGTSSAEDLRSLPEKTAELREGYHLYLPVGSGFVVLEAVSLANVAAVTAALARSRAHFVESVKQFEAAIAGRTPAMVLDLMAATLHVHEPRYDACPWNDPDERRRARVTGRFAHWLSENHRDGNYLVWKTLAAVPGLIKRLRKSALYRARRGKNPKKVAYARALADGFLWEDSRAHWVF